MGALFVLGDGAAIMLLFAGQMLFGGTAVGLMDEADKGVAGGYGIIGRGIRVNGVLGMNAHVPDDCLMLLLGKIQMPAS